MPLRMWTLDVAREQSLTYEHLLHYAKFTLESGYDSMGLYLEHRFAYASAPWAQGTGCVTPESVRRLRRELPDLQIVPFINLLGHMEGFLHCEPGRALRETPFKGMQGCPSNPAFVRFCEGLLDDTLTAFDSEIVHLGGDETWELAKCPACRPEGDESLESKKAKLYAEHFAPLVEQVVAKGRRPAVWGDMFLEHPAALSAMPRATLVFDWQYHNGLKESSPQLTAQGHDVVGCPTVHVFDAAWMHLQGSDKNVREVSLDARDLGLAGVCLTTWECGLLGAYDTVLPAVKWARRIMDDPGAKGGLTGAFDDQEWAKLMGEDLNELGGVFAFDGHRNRLKCRLLLYRNPFLAWMHHGDQLSGQDGQKVLEICERAMQATQDEAFKGVTLFVRSAVEFVRMAEAAHQWYAQGEPEEAIKALAPARHAFDTLATVAKRTHDRTGGSLADMDRCRLARAHLEKVILRIHRYGRGELGYVPAFDTLVHPQFVPHDQAGWWGVNKWGNE